MSSPFTYDPDQNYEVRVYDVEYRRTQEKSWEARIYQPQGSGPFPALLFVHGGAWNTGTRTSGELINHNLAVSGLVVVAIDFRIAPEHPYPAQVVDVNYATRWLKAHATEFNSDAYNIGGLGSSSSGHTIMLSAMRPHDPRYTAISSPEVEGHDATFAYLLQTWPVLDPYARYLHAKNAGMDRLVISTEAYFLNKEAMHEGNPQVILEGQEKVELPPTLIIQGTADENVPMSIPERFVEAYRSASGEIELEIFPDMPHGFGSDPRTETDRSLRLMKAFVARQLARSAAPV